MHSMALMLGRRKNPNLFLNGKCYDAVLQITKSQDFVVYCSAKEVLPVTFRLFLFGPEMILLREEISCIYLFALGSCSNFLFSVFTASAGR